MSNVIKFQAPFEKLKLYHTSPDINLRRSIILQAIIDSTNTDENKEAKKFEEEAKNWIFHDQNSSFKRICLEAGIEADFIRNIARELISWHHKNNKKHNIGLDIINNSKIKQKMKGFCKKRA